MNFDLYTRSLSKKEGIWYASEKRSISYPDDGNELCYQLEENSFWFKHRNNCIVELIKNFPPNGSLFDIGGGNGYVAKAIESIGIEPVLVEPGERGCLNARKRNLGNIICSTLEDAGFEKKSIPAIGVFDVVEHFESDIDFLNYIHSYLIKDGMLYLTVPSYNFLWSNEDNDAGHHNRYTITSLNNKLGKLGFKIEFASYMFSILPIPILLFRSLPSWLGMNKKSKDMNNKHSEHGKENRLLSKLWAWELNRIRQRKTIQFGGSCLVAARKL